MTGSKPTVLVVDDTPENIDVLVGILRDSYAIKAARDGHTAIKLCHAGPPPALILLDVMMPGISGYEVCEALKKDPRTHHVPVIFVTARADTESEIRALEVGAVDFVTKPVNPPVVRARVATHLALHEQNRELDRKVHEQTLTLHQTRQKVIERLGRAVEYKDTETGMHVVRMSQYSRLIGIAAGLDEYTADLLLDAAPMHDIGKIGIPDSILQKPGKLNPAEWETMKAHTTIGAAIIGDDDSELLRMARQVALTHHEKWDGSGYPNGLAGDDIPLVGRIVAIADVFDALTSRRPYKAPWPLEKAVDFLREQAGQHFDPELIPLFIERMDEAVEIMNRHQDPEYDQRPPTQLASGAPTQPPG